MKRFLAGLFAFSMAVCAFTSCGHDEGDEILEESLIEESTEEETTEEEISEEEVISDTEEITETEEEELTDEEEENIDGDNSAGYIDVVQRYVDSAVKGDLTEMLYLSYPSSFVNAMTLMAELEGEEDYPEDLIYVDDSFELKEYRINGIISEEPIEDELEMIDTAYCLTEELWKYIEETGKENITVEMLENKFDEFMEMYEEGEITLGGMVTKAYDITVSATAVMNDGTEETEESNVMVYYVEGEGWKIDNAFRGYVRKSKQVAANTMASSILKAGNASLVELDEEGVEIPDRCIISSDSTKNYNVDGEFEKRFKEKMYLFFADAETSNYFVLIQNGSVWYSAVDCDGKVGTYPPNSLYNLNYDDEGVLTDDYTYEDVYNDSLEKFSE
ncbi:MAG: hypothetical protein K2J08_04040 [Ruminococcus sp.]|nr:hypothetical protein [Ruminococcus sp.]